MSIILLVLLLSSIGSIFGLNGFVFTIVNLLLLPVFYYNFGLAFDSPLLAYSCFLIFLIPFYIFLFNKKFKTSSLESFIENQYEVFLFSLIFTFLYQLSLSWADFYSLGERMRDLALIGAGIRQPIYIQEPWMAEVGLNYYAYWYRFCHMLSVLLDLKSWEVYHLIVSFAPSLLVLSVYLCLKKIFNFSKLHSSLLSVLIIFISNPAGIYYFFIKSQSWWYPSRVVTGVIHEYPSWSFLLGDAHPHFLNSGIFVFFIYLSSRFFEQGRVLFLILPIFFFFNANMWEVPIWIAYISVLLFVYLSSAKFENQSSLFKQTKETRLVNSSHNLIYYLSLSILLLMLYTMKSNFIPIDSKVAFVGYFLEKAVLNSKPIEFFMHWGFFLVVIIYYQIKILDKHHYKYIIALVLSSLFSSVLPFLIVLLFLSLNAFYLRAKNSNKISAKNENFVAEVILLLSISLLLVPEIVFLDDPYGGDNERMNTFFKISYVNWTLMFLSSCYLLRGFISKLNINNFLYLFVPTFLILSSFFIFNLDKRPVSNTSSIRGLDFLDKKYQGVKDAVLFLSQQEFGTVLEAQGPPYSETAMVATLTAFPSYIGWVNHVNLLMPDRLGQVNERLRITDEIYESKDCEHIKKTLKSNSIKYLIFGDLERKKYPESNVEQYQCLGDFFTRETYSIFQVS